MSERPQLVAIDLDGTLLTSDKRVSKRSAEAIKALEAQGVRVAIATGRPLRTARQVFEQLELRGHAVVFNGSAVYHLAEGRFVHNFCFDVGVARAIVADMRQAFPEVDIGLEKPHTWTIEPQRYERIKHVIRSHNFPEPELGLIEDKVDDNVLKVHFRHKRHDAEYMGDAILPQHPVYYTWHRSAEGSLLEVLPQGVNKRHALQQLAADLGISAKDIAAFGDEHNDLAMLSWVGHPVAMANANSEVKRLAAEITLSNDEDGVAHVLERWL